MKLVYQKINEYDYIQKYIEDDESIPVRWSDTPPEIESDNQPSLQEILEKQAKQINVQSKAIEDLALMIAQGGVE